MSVGKRRHFCEENSYKVGVRCCWRFPTKWVSIVILTKWVSIVILPTKWVSIVIFGRVGLGHAALAVVDHRARLDAYVVGDGLQVGVGVVAKRVAH